MDPSSSTQAETNQHIESEESKQHKVLLDLQKQLEILRNEVSSQPQLIVKGIQETVMEQSDVIMLRCSHLTNMPEIRRHVREMFVDSPILNVIADTAIQLITTMKSSIKLTELMKWHQRTIKTRINDEVCGIEIHYKIKLLYEATTGADSNTNKNEVALIAYKCKAYTLNIPLTAVLDNNELQQLTSR
ncbi:unnamed protein product [Adineta steineri]|uniref:Uncharacterized protein n=1 Tax=Adineta steineri TaxID=433720 RepID=A0A820HM53_9BILA|nr:unnamed protein product [Adineta steineri]